mmetsp:Transcript_27052/g.83334  ORF Transcript_27052/g.83334 Transcript_27052/m.83334 type:complete len:283 (+) Transcript_27052:354-1202(+)
MKQPPLASTSQHMALAPGAARQRPSLRFAWTVNRTPQGKRFSNTIGGCSATVEAPVRAFVSMPRTAKASDDPAADRASFFERFPAPPPVPNAVVSDQSSPTRRSRNVAPASPFGSGVSASALASTGSAEPSDGANSKSHGVLFLTDARAARRPTTRPSSSQKAARHARPRSTPTAQGRAQGSADKARPAASRTSKPAGKGAPSAPPSSKHAPAATAFQPPPPDARASTAAPVSFRKTNAGASPACSIEPLHSRTSRPSNRNIRAAKAVDNTTSKARGVAMST